MDGEVVNPEGEVEEMLVVLHYPEGPESDTEIVTPQQVL
jgi:hypothetical protein